MAGRSGRPLTGSEIGSYHVLGLLGAGGMGEVYLARDTRLERKVAIKILSSNSLDDEHARKRLLREAQAAATLDHPNICAIYEIGEDSGRSFIVMQYVEGETLADVIQRNGLNVNAVVAKRLPALTDREGDIATASIASIPGLVAGTVPYMSPEQVRGEKLDARTDVFSFGVLMYEALSGQQPFTRRSMPETLSAVLTHEPPSLASIAPDTPLALQQIVARCLVKDKAERYQTAAEVRDDLRSLHGAILAERPSASAPVPSVWQ